MSYEVRKEMEKTISEKMLKAIYERLGVLCEKNGTNPTALCVKVTGSKGNLATWKKGHIRSDYLIVISEEFNVPTDYILKGTPHLRLVKNKKEMFIMDEKSFEALSNLFIEIGKLYPAKYFQSQHENELRNEKAKYFEEYSFIFEGTDIERLPYDERMGVLYDWMSLQFDNNFCKMTPTAKQISTIGSNVSQKTGNILFVQLAEICKYHLKNIKK